MKKTTSVILLLVFTLSLIFTSCAGAGKGANTISDKFIINNISVNPSGSFEPVHLGKKGQLIIPLEYVCQMQGIEYTQNDSDKTAVIKLDNKSVTVKAGSDKIQTPSGEVQMPEKAVLKNGVLYVPAEPILSPLGYAFKSQTTDQGTIVNATGNRGKAKYETMQKLENFDTDPGVYGEHNEIDEAAHNVVNLDYGYRSYNGENVIGGKFQRCIDKSYYAINLPKDLSFEGKISFSGKFVVPYVEGSSDVIFGLFNQNSIDWRTNNSLFLRLDGDAPKKYFVYFEYGTQDVRTNWAGCYSRPTYQESRGDNPGDPDDRLIASQAYHSFSLDYDPNSYNGNGGFTCKLDDKTYTFELLEGHKEAGAFFNQFGLMTESNIGNSLEAYFKDITLNGTPITDLSPSGGWIGHNNVLKNYKSSMGKGVCEFGYRDSNYAGKNPGELTGAVWRLDENRWSTPAYAGVSTGILDLTVPLHASGKFTIPRRGKDSSMVLGWFNSQTPQPDQGFLDVSGPRNSIGAHLEGLSVDGNYFSPIFAANEGKGEQSGTGPVAYPRVVYDFTIDYTPNPDGTGTVVTTLNGKPATMTVPKEVVDNSVFDSFGVVSYIRGGTFIYFAVDDIEYTVRKQ